MMEWMDSTLGSIFYSIVIFTAGAMIGKPLWCWIRKKMPFMECPNCK